MNSIPDLANFAADSDPSAFLFDIIIRRDNYFTKGTGDEFDIDPDFVQFNILCQSYIKSLKHLITVNVETVDYSLNKAASMMKGDLYANIVHYNRDGIVKDSNIVKIRFSSFSAVVHSHCLGDKLIVKKAFIFDIVY